MKYLFIHKLRNVTINSEKRLKEVIQNNSITLYRKYPYPKPGMKAVMTDKRPACWNEAGRMDEFLGCTLTISDILGSQILFEEEKTKNWTFRLWDIKEIIE